MSGYEYNGDRTTRVWWSARLDEYISDEALVVCKKCDMPVWCDMQAEDPTVCPECGHKTGVDTCK